MYKTACIIAFSFLVLSIYFDSALPSIGGLNVVDVAVVASTACVLGGLSFRYQWTIPSAALVYFALVAGVYYVVIAIVYVLAGGDAHVTTRDLAPNFRYLLGFFCLTSVCLMARNGLITIHTFLILLFASQAPHLMAAVQQALTVYWGIGAVSEWFFIPERKEGVDLTWSVAGITGAQYTLASLSLASFVVGTSFILEGMRTNRDRMLMLVAGVLMLMSLFCIALTLRRLQMASVLLTFVVILFFYCMKCGSLSRFFKASACAVTLIWAATWIVNHLGRVSGRLKAFDAFLDGDTDASSLRTYYLRVDQIGFFASQIREYPWGTLIWPGNVDIFTGDISYLSQWLWGGVIGGVLYVLFHLWMVVFGLRTYRRAATPSTAFASLTLAGLGVGFTLRAMGAGAGLQVPSSFVFWLIAGFCIGVIHRRDRQDEFIDRRGSRTAPPVPRVRFPLRACPRSC